MSDRERALAEADDILRQPLRTGPATRDMLADALLRWAAEAHSERAAVIKECAERAMDFKDSWKIAQAIDALAISTPGYVALRVEDVACVAEACDCDPAGESEHLTRCDRVHAALASAKEQR